MPIQPLAIRPSRALPYEMHTSARADVSAGGVWLRFSSKPACSTCTTSGTWIARRDTVEASKQRNGFWNAVELDSGRYDLWVPGPNGYHRHFCGDVNALALSDAAAPEVRVCDGIANGNVYLPLLNRSENPVAVPIQANADDPADSRWRLAAEGLSLAKRHWELPDSGHGYDFTPLARLPRAGRNALPVA